MLVDQVEDLFIAEGGTDIYVGYYILKDHDEGLEFLWGCRPRPSSRDNADHRLSLGDYLTGHG